MFYNILKEVLIQGPLKPLKSSVWMGTIITWLLTGICPVRHTRWLFIWLRALMQTQTSCKSYRSTWRASISLYQPHTKSKSPSRTLKSSNQVSRPDLILSIRRQASCSIHRYEALFWLQWSEWNGSASRRRLVQIPFLNAQVQYN